MNDLTSSITRSLGFITLLAITAPAGAEGGSMISTPHLEHGPHHLSLLLAGTDVSSEDPAFTIGGDYEYRLNDLIGVGAVIEHAFGELEATSVLAVVDIHIFRGLALQVGPGYEFSEKHDVFIGRVGALYEFEFGQYTLSPQLHYDIHDGVENAVVFGLAIGTYF